jgi:hypothetical protein
MVNQKRLSPAVAFFEPTTGVLFDEAKRKPSAAEKFETAWRRTGSQE